MNIANVTIIKTVSSTVLARADITFDWFELKGFKILQNQQSKKVYVTPPSYHSPSGWRQLFRTLQEKDWEQITSKVIQKYEEEEMKSFIDETLDK